MRAPRAALARAFPQLAALQPVSWTRDGLVCAPRAGGEEAADALARCPLPTVPLLELPAWPRMPAAWVAGWYRRSPDHAPAPEGVAELVQVPGEGFGTADHATTAMCLARIAELPAGGAVDVGCGAGLLAQAWARLGRGPVLAVDIDAAAIDHARRSLAAAGVRAGVELRQAPLESLAPAELEQRALIANVPIAAQRALLDRLARPPRAALLSGVRPAQAPWLLSAWRRHGLRARRVTRRGCWACLLLVRA